MHIKQNKHTAAKMESIKIQVQLIIINRGQNLHNLSEIAALEPGWNISSLQLIENVFRLKENFTVQEAERN